MEERFLKYGIVFIFAFIAELIDGTIGMGYGVSLTTFLLSFGMGTAMASAVVHISEIFTTFVSGVSHFKIGNFDKKIFICLVIPGVIGGAAGAYSAVKFQNASLIKPFISSILLLLGLLIIIKYIKKREFLEQEYQTPRKSHLIPLGLIASFIDAIGGGGWGPISTPALIINNTNPKKAIGSVNFAEFFVTLSISLTFFLAMPKIEWDLLIFMIAGGIIAAPIAAIAMNKLPHRALGIIVGCLVVFLSIKTILKALYF
ncbi:MAG: sulfite exporter TauE/SafE family protein [Gammaproteobacteria bacterium]|nr:sulfite exporter TauE/SafE family protein [Gammaproteobacteria bacterium]